VTTTAKEEEVIGSRLSRQTGKQTARAAVPAAKSAVKTIAAVSETVGELRGRAKASRGSRASQATAFLAGAGAGAAGQYLLDSREGKRRRHVLRDKALSKVRRGAAESERRARYLAGQAAGVAAEATPPARDASELNDAALAAKAESELFRPADAPKGSVNVNVEDGVLYLRGAVDSEDELADLVSRAQAIEGISRVENLVHLPGEPAKSKT
jgi:osmotically-inducible protein OsmY